MFSHSKPRPIRYSNRFWRQSWLRYAVLLCSVTLFLCILSSVLSPSFAHPPQHYTSLRHTAQSSSKPGRVNPQNEKVFIAASLYDPKGRIVSGAWSRSLLELIDLIGAQNTYLSIYESDSGFQGASALERLEKEVVCNHSIVIEEKVSWNDTARISLPNGDAAIKRIAYLAAARNRALDPLDDASSIKYDKILYLNDVIFDPIEASQLLFSTNLQYNGRTKYQAACALDFKLPFIYYDTFATRDLEGYGLGLPIYPWFSTAGRGHSRQDVLQRKDAVRVKSCWGGMVALDAHYFQADAVPMSAEASLSAPSVRFRAEPDLDWEYSECCLVHADLAAKRSPHSSQDSQEHDTDIYMNPYIRTAYSEWTFSYLNLLRRIEKLFRPVQSVINLVVGLPFHNERRTLKAGQPITKLVWVENNSTGNGAWRHERLPASSGGFCGIRAPLMIRKLDPVDGQKNWEKMPLSLIPSLTDDGSEAL